MNPTVSIVCNAYNQEEFIGDAIESFLMQETEFEYEILIHDDASTDGTAAIIKKYAEMHPNIIYPIFQKENQYSKHIGIYKNIQYPRARGKYIAFCEGDDYWISPQKLQKQVMILESHPNINMCAHAAFEIYGDNKTKITQTAPSKKEEILSVESVIEGGGGFLATNSLVWRKKL